MRRKRAADVERAAQATEPAAPERRRVSREAAKTLHASLAADMVLADVAELRLILEGHCTSSETYRVPVLVSKTEA